MTEQSNNNVISLSTWFSQPPSIVLPFGGSIPSLQLQFAKSLDKDRTYAAAGGVIYRWTGTHWHVVGAQELECQAATFAVQKDPEKAHEKFARSAAATAALLLPKLPERKQNKRGGLPAPVIPTLSGYVEIMADGSIAVRQPDPLDGLTYSLACEYDAAATAPRFDAFLSEALPDAGVRAFLQEFAGYTLLGDTRHEVAAWLIGDGGTGKGTVGVVMQALHRNAIALSLNALDGFRLTGLTDASLVYVDETPTTRIDEQMIKSCISGDMIQADRKNRDPISFSPTAKWIINGNHLPPISDHTSGFWRRFIVFPFYTKPAKKQPMLGEYIAEHELAGVLNWALAGLVRLLDRGEFPELPEPMAKFREEIKLSTDSVASWASEAEAVITDTPDTSKSAIYTSYVAYCRNSGLKHVSEPNFWKRLKSAFPGLTEAQPRQNGRRVKMVNIKFQVIGITDDCY